MPLWKCDCSNSTNISQIQYQKLRTTLRNEKLQHLRKQNIGKIVASIMTLFTVLLAMAWMAVRVLYNNATLGDLGVFYQIFSRGQSLMGHF